MIDLSVLQIKHYQKGVLFIRMTGIGNSLERPSTKFEKSLVLDKYFTFE